MSLHWVTNKCQRCDGERTIGTTHCCVCGKFLCSKCTRITNPGRTEIRCPDCEGKEVVYEPCSLKTRGLLGE